MPAATTSGSFRSCGWPSAAPRRWRWPWSPIGWSGPAARGFSTRRGATVLQHGIAHADHAVPPAKKIELGGECGARTAADRTCGRGRELLADAFGEPLRAGARAALEPDRSRPGAVAAGRRVHRPLDLRAAARGRGGARAAAGQHASGPRRLARGWPPARPGSGRRAAGRTGASRTATSPSASSATIR